MKNKILLSMALIASLTMGTKKAEAQGMAVNTSGAAANSSSMLDVTSTSKGMLIPRMTAAQKIAISGPATGLMIFQTDGTSGFYYWDGGAWTAVGGGGSPTGAAGGGLAGTYPNPTIATGAIGIAQHSATGTASSTTFLRGDNTWSAAGTGTVTSLSSGNLTPLFTSSVATATTTPAITYTLSSSAAFTVLTNSTNAIGSPSYGKVVPSALFATSGSADNTHFYRGDGTWQTIAAGAAFVVTGFQGQPPGTAGTYYSGFAGNTTTTSLATAVAYPIAKTCTLDLFTLTPQCYATHLSGSANVITGTVLKNGSSTGITISFTAPTTSTVDQVFTNVTDNTHTAIFNAGDQMQIQWTQTNAVNGALDRFYITMHFTE